ncbi:MAG: LPS-assembly protein LptD, partial [Alphaproteobacteria bacterium]|nr:LPS-assembly protein LptD [Alphaproteobacteria bacterium]
MANRMVRRVVSLVLGAVVSLMVSAGAIFVPDCRVGVAQAAERRPAPPFAGPPRARPQFSEQPRDTPSLLTADEVIYDEELGIVTARGRVEVSQGPRILVADQVTFNQKTNTVTASGNVSLVEPTGDVMFSDYVEMSGDFKDGLIENLRVLLSDNSKLAADRAVRVDGNRK